MEPQIYEMQQSEREKENPKRQKRREMRVVKIHAGGKRRGKQKLGEGGERKGEMNGGARCQREIRGRGPEEKIFDFFASSSPSKTQP